MVKIDEERLNQEIKRLYSKIKNGTMEQNSTELYTYMWLAELRDRRCEEDNVNFYRAKVKLNKNESIHFESKTKKILIDSMKHTLNDDRFKNDTIDKITIYSLKEVDEMSYEELLKR